MVSRYCKAFEESRFRAFPGWAPTAARRPDDVPERADAEHDGVLFLHETLVVTEGIYEEEDVVFRSESPEWRAFCAEVLGFSLPDSVTPAAPPPTANG